MDKGTTPTIYLKGSVIQGFWLQAMGGFILQGPGIIFLSLGFGL